MDSRKSKRSRWEILSENLRARSAALEQLNKETELVCDKGVNTFKARLSESLVLGESIIVFQKGEDDFRYSQQIIVYKDQAQALHKWLGRLLDEE